MLFRWFVGPCGLHGEVVVPHMAQGPMVQVSGVWGFLALVGFGVCGFGPSYSLNIHVVIVWWGLGGFGGLVGSRVMGLSLIWPKDPQCRCLVRYREFVGAAVKVRSLVWPKDPKCRCLVELRIFEGACGLHSEGVVPCMAQGPTV